MDLYLWMILRNLSNNQIKLLVPVHSTRILMELRLHGQIIGIRKYLTRSLPKGYYIFVPDQLNDSQYDSINNQIFLLEDEEEIERLNVVLDYLQD